MIVSTGYGVISTPAENTGMSQTLGVSTSSYVYVAVEAALAGTTYISPVAANSSHDGLRRNAITTWLGSHTNSSGPRMFGGNL